MPRRPKPVFPPQEYSFQHETPPSVAGHIQKALFASTSVKVGGKSEKMPKLHAYARRLLSEGQQGKRGAKTEVAWLVNRLDRAGMLDIVKEGPVDPQAAGREVFQKQQVLLRRLKTFMYAMMYSEVENAFVAAKGTKVYSKLIKPWWIDYDEAIRVNREVSKRLRKPGEPYEVGRGKPPVANRFKPGQSGNKAGRKRKSFLQEMRTALLEEGIVIDAAGSKSTCTRVEMQVATALKAALEGDREARRAVRRYVEMLDKKNMLFAPPEPPKRKRRSRKPPSLEAVAVQDGLAVIFCFSIKQWLVRAFTD